ncbi:hypothetical protein FA15DRAFT_755344 [Coprinopsis marcescibilis]|nr:hypothetical protein FA15DRAFT_755344 [Coprinopsis marcescibilis]
MTSYGLAVFFETAPGKREGRGPYICIGCIIFVLFTVSACVDILKPFDALLEASDGLEYLGLASHKIPTWEDIVSELSMSLVFIFADGLLLYRCYLMFIGGSWWILVLPILTYLSTIAVSIFLIFPLPPGGVTSVETFRNILSLVTNIFITSMISYRVVATHREAEKAVSGQHLAVYTTVVRILLESALPLSLVGIVQVAIHIVPVVSGPRRMQDYTGDARSLLVAAHTTSAVYYALQAIAPQMIIFRVTTGRSWAQTDRSSDAEAFSCSIAFTQGPLAGDVLSMSDRGTIEEEARIL